MNGNIYVRLSCKDLGVSQSGLSDIRAVLPQNLKPYFGTVLNVSFIDADRAENVEVIIMDKPKYPDCENDIKQKVDYIFTSRIRSLTPEKVGVKINYAQFNPNFDPVKKNHGKDVGSDGVKRTQANSSDKADKEKRKKTGSQEFDYEELSLNYSAFEPRYSFDQVILPPKTLEQIERAIGILEVEHKVFDEWGLRSIIPTASSALSFYGPPGTGKSMAAEAIAQKLGKKILSATYADIESKFHGEGPKMVKAIFRAAERDNAVLFLDESDSLLSKRLTNVSDGSAQAINSMRSQLMISLEHYKGIVIFATNLVVNYDKAFLSRLINIEFTMPSFQERVKIWWNHLRTDKIRVPLSTDVDIDYLAEHYAFCGREIKSAVKSACIAAALDRKEKVTQEDFIKACDATKDETLRVVSANDYTVSRPMNDENKKDLIDTMQKNE